VVCQAAAERFKATIGNLSPACRLGLRNRKAAVQHDDHVVTGTALHNKILPR